MKDEPKTLEIFENEIDFYLQEFAERDSIEDFKAVPQSVWNSALRYVHDKLFRYNKDIMKQHKNTVIEGAMIPSTYNAYDYDIVLEIVDYYVYNMCMRYNKEISIIGFTTLTGIDESIIYDWGNNSSKLSSSSSKIYKRLTQMREESLSNKLVDGKQNPVGTIAVLNRQFGWASPYTSDANKQRTALTDAELPKLATKDANFRQIAQLENGQEILEKAENP